MLPMKLQYFAEDPKPLDDPAGGNGGEPKTKNDPEPKPNPEDKPEGGKSFTRDDVAKMLNAEKQKWQEEHNSELEKAKSEGAKLAKMSAKEREEAETKKKLDDLEKREQDLDRRELEVATKNELATNNLPESFLNIVIGSDAESTNANIKQVKETFDKAVKEAVTESLKSPLPKSGNPTSGDSMTSRIQQNLANIK